MVMNAARNISFNNNGHATIIYRSFVCFYVGINLFQNVIILISIVRSQTCSYINVVKIYIALLLFRKHRLAYVRMPLYDLNYLICL